MAEPRKIVYMIGSMRRGGAEGQVLELLRHFSRSGWSCSLYLLNEVGEHLEEVRRLGVPVRGFDFEKRHSIADPRTSAQVLGTVSRIARALEEDRPEILHCFLYWANVFGAWAGRRVATPRIVTSRRSLGDFKNGRAWMQWVENWTNGFVDAVTVNSRAVLEDTLARERIDPAKVRLIYNGVTFGAPAADSEIDASLYGADLAEAQRQGARLILCVANLIHYKGHLTLVDALADVAKDFPDVRLLLAGRDGGMESAIREKAAALGVSDRVVFLGMQTNLAPLYGAADVVVLPSHEEGFSNVILEAMAAGKAIVASRVGGIPEAIEDGVHGLLVPSRDAKALATALARVLNDNELRARLGAAAKERALREFSLEAMFQNYETFYAELLAREKAKR